MNRLDTGVFVVSFVLLIVAVLFIPLNIFSDDSFGFASYPGFSNPIPGVVVDNNVILSSTSDVVSRSFDVSDAIVYRRGYVSYDSQNWEQYNLTSTGVATGDWYYSKGTANVLFSPTKLRLTSARNFTNNSYVLFYSCSKNLSAQNWDCHGGWQILQFNAKLNISVSNCSSGNQTRNCSIIHGVGHQLFACVNGNWVSSGPCSFYSCDSGYNNCDGNISNGCETNIYGSDVNNCGNCKITCNGTCSGGICSVPSTICTPTIKECVGTSAYRQCNSAGSAWVNTNCLSNQTCSAGVCKTVVTGKIYYVATNGSNSWPGTINQPFKTITYAISKISGGDTIFVRTGTYNEEVLILGKSGTAEKPTIISAYPGEHPIIDGTGITPTTDALVFFYFNDYTHLIGFEVKNSNKNGIQIRGSHCRLSNCTVHDINAAGILAQGDYSIVEYCTVYRVSMANENAKLGAYAPALSACRDTVDGSTDNAIIRHNIVHDSWGEGISTFESTNTTIEDNIIYDTYSVHLYLSDTKNSIAQRNLVYRTKAMGDWNNGFQCGIGMWDEVGGKFTSVGNIVINNIVYGANRNLRIGELTNCTVANNVFVNSCSYASIEISPDNSYDGGRILNNIIVQEDSLLTINVPANKNIAFSNNLYNKAYDNDAVGSGDIIGSPLFTKTGSVSSGQLTADYFRLLAGSPAIDKGKVVVIVKDDYFGNTRTSKPDIGAIENNP